MTPRRSRYAGSAPVDGPAQLELLGAEVHQLRQALEARQLIGPAIGVLVQRHRWTPEEAFSRLRTLSQHYNVKVTRLARAVVLDALARPVAVDTEGMDSADSELTGWMTAQDAELLRVLSKGLDRETRAHDAATIAQHERATRGQLAAADGPDDRPSSSA